MGTGAFEMGTGPFEMGTGPFEMGTGLFSKSPVPFFWNNRFTIIENNAKMYKNI